MRPDFLLNLQQKQHIAADLMQVSQGDSSGKESTCQSMQETQETWVQSLS